VHGKRIPDCAERQISLRNPLTELNPIPFTRPYRIFDRIGAVAKIEHIPIIAPTAD
jgi:hypothetical protein